MIANAPAGDCDSSHLTVNPIVGLDQTFLYRGRERDDLKSRTRFIDVLQRPIRPRLGSRVAGLFGSKLARLRVPEFRQCADRERLPFLFGSPTLLRPR